MRRLLPLLGLCLAAACRRGEGAPAGGTGALVRIEAVMADPREVPDARGEFVLVRNAGTAAVDLRGWEIASGGDRPHVIAGDVRIPAGEEVVLARTTRPGGDRRAAYAWGGGLALGNGRDWLALRDRRGRTVDSVAWSAARRGVAMPRAELAGRTIEPAPGVGAALPGPATGARAPLVVKVLDVGQGDAIYVENGGSRALIDGGADPAALERHLDALGLRDTTLDVVVVTHPHLDHYNGLRAVFRSWRRLAVRYVFDARDPSPNRTLAELRDSVAARARRGELQVRDADDPCGDGRPSCTISMRGGARLVVWRPWPSDTASPNNRSVAVKVVAADSAFSMWLAGDGEREAIAWMERAGHQMRAHAMKANHHGSCDGTTPSYLRRVAPQLVVLSLGPANDYGYVHAQTTRMLRDAGVSWLRTDVNGTVTVTAPGHDGRAWDVTFERGARDARGRMDRRSGDPKCND